jgi:hypothetical protein
MYIFANGGIEFNSYRKSKKCQLHFIIVTETNKYLFN